jgi:hypothetical protein
MAVQLVFAPSTTMAMSSEERAFFGRIRVSELPVAEHTLSVPLDELFGKSKPAARGKRGPAPQWQQQVETVAQLPRSQRRFVARTIQTVQTEASIR